MLLARNLKTGYANWSACFLLPCVVGMGTWKKVDKSMVVVGGFGNKVLVDAEALLRDVLQHIEGFEDVSMTTNEFPLRLVRFTSPTHALKFICAEKKHQGMQVSKLWASENRSRSERCRLKAVSKLKKFLIELGGYAQCPTAMFRK